MKAPREHIVKKLKEVYENPNQELEKRSGLTYPTILRFLKGLKIRPYNLDRLLEISLDLIEERQEHRKGLLERSKRVLKAEHIMEHEASPRVTP